MEISAHICNMVEQSIEEINRADDILQEKESSDVVGKANLDTLISNEILYVYVATHMQNNTMCTL